MFLSKSTHINPVCTQNSPKTLRFVPKIFLKMPKNPIFSVITNYGIISQSIEFGKNSPRKAKNGHFGIKNRVKSYLLNL